jgi:glycosyltransferase involved in cell wall biosynthesis
MKIAVLSPFEEAVPPIKYGGTELVVYNVVQNLVKLGHQVTLVATGDSKTSAKLFPVFPASIRKIPATQDAKNRDALKYIGVGKVVSYLNKNKFDVIHNNIGWRVLPFQSLLSAPMVTTLHGPLDIPYQQFVYGEYAKANYISISLSQRRGMPSLNFVANVYNGIEVGKFEFNDRPKDYFAFLGRMSPEKGPVQAIEIAKKAGVKLIMAAKVDAVDKAFFDKNVKPKIDGKQIKFIGEVDHAGKVELLKNAKALLAPIQWEEPFGLFFVEAMACGAPVITMNRGSVPELVIDGKTGFIGKTNADAVKAVKNIGQLNRQDAYEHVAEKFSAMAMTKGYLDAYKKVAKPKSKPFFSF